MNRYTFKAKRKDNNEWVYGYVYEQKNNRYVILEGIGTKIKVVAILQETLCQCTGLQDIDGKDIFENDLAKLPSFIEDDKIAVCIYNEEHNVDDVIGFGFYTYSEYHKDFRNIVGSDEWDEFEIIGNKFDKEEY